MSIKLDLDLLKLLKEAKTKVRDPGMTKMVEAAYVKLKDHLSYFSERQVPSALFSASVADCDIKEMANVIFLNMRTKPVLIANKRLKQKTLGQNSKTFRWTALRNLLGIAAWEEIGILNKDGSTVVN